MKLLMAIVRATSLEHIVKELAEIGIRDVTISEVKGIGEQLTVFNAYAIHKMMQLVVPADKVKEIEEIIIRLARSGFAGDGIIVVCPVDHMIKIRTNELHN